MNYPDDWPAPGPIDLVRHDLPHASSTLEWWYINGHFRVAEKRPFSFFASFFRTAVGQDEETGLYVYAHALTWCLVDVENRRYLAESLVDTDAPAIGREKLKQGEGPTDERLRRALSEILERDQIPLPDKMFDGPVLVDSESLRLEFGDCSFTSEKPGQYHLKLIHQEEELELDIQFTPNKPPIRHGDDGVVRGAKAEDMFYYFMPRCSMHGTLQLDGETWAITKGDCWYDHEFGRNPDPEAQTSVDLKDTSWNWISTQLSNGCEISVYDLFEDREGSKPCGNFAIIIRPDGSREQYNEFSFEPLERWTSTQTFNSYPTSWRLRIPEVGVELDVEAAFSEQEFLTLISKPAFWEGRVHCSGKMEGKAVRGLGFIERTGFETVEALDGFFKAVSKATRKSVARILPLEPTPEDATVLIASDDHPHYLQGVDLDQLSSALIRPIREIVDRGGKAWRSYVALACCDIVGGDSAPLAEWLALPELMHVGSLLVDDVEDKSEIRRGGPAAHIVHGEPIAINAGNACYFFPQIFIDRLDADAEQRLRIYSCYFDAVRAAHAGQAIDIDGHADAFRAAVESGKGHELEDRVRAVHRLKSGAPASALGRIGAILGHGSDAQIASLGHYLEALGTAFQIIDDALNLRGFEGDLKDRGEDLVEGKVTMPVAKAMSRLEKKDRMWLHETLTSKPHDAQLVGKMISMLEECGAIDACDVESKQLVDDAWQRVDGALPDSFFKMRLRAFGWYVLERHY